MHLEKLRFPKNRKKIQEAHVASADLEKRRKRASNSKMTVQNSTNGPSWPRSTWTSPPRIFRLRMRVPVKTQPCSHYSIEQSSVSFFSKIPRTRGQTPAHLDRPGHRLSRPVKNAVRLAAMDSTPRPSKTRDPFRLPSRKWRTQIAR